MKFQKVFWGSIMLLFGLIILLENFGLFDIHWSMVFHFWPVFIVLWGISMLPVKPNQKAIFMALVVIATITAFLWISNSRPGYFEKHHKFQIDIHDDDQDDPIYEDKDTNDIDV